MSNFPTSLTQRPLHYIDGAFSAAPGQGRLDLVNPFTESVFGAIALGTRADVDAAVAAARAAFRCSPPAPASEVSRVAISVSRAKRSPFNRSFARTRRRASEFRTTRSPLEAESATECLYFMRSRRLCNSTLSRSPSHHAESSALRSQANNNKQPAPDTILITQETRTFIARRQHRPGLRPSMDFHPDNRKLFGHPANIRACHARRGFP